MKIGAIIEGMQILRRYYEDGDGYNVGAEHDQIYVYATDKPLTEGDQKKLIQLGWFQEGGADDDGGEYNPEEAWTAYV